MEIYLIATILMWDSTLEDAGGSNGGHSEETKKILRNSKIGKTISLLHKENIRIGMKKAFIEGRNVLPIRSGKENSFFGKHHTEECRIIMSQKKIGLFVGGKNGRAILVINSENGIYY